MKRFKIFKILGIVLLIIIALSLSFAIPLHVSEIIAMKECASRPGCMYCVPIKSMIASYIYTICVILLIISIILFVIYKVKNKTNIENLKEN